MSSLAPIKSLIAAGSPSTAGRGAVAYVNDGLWDAQTYVVQTNAFLADRAADPAPGLEGFEMGTPIPQDQLPPGMQPISSRQPGPVIDWNAVGQWGQFFSPLVDAAADRIAPGRAGRRQQQPMFDAGPKTGPMQFVQTPEGKTDWAKIAIMGGIGAAAVYALTR